MREFFDLTKAANVDALYYCFTPTYGPDFYFSGERHDFWECVFVLDGMIGVAEEEQIYELSQNDIIFHKPMEFHRIWSAGGTSPHLITTSFKASGVCVDLLGEGVFTLPPHLVNTMTEMAKVAIDDIIYGNYWENDPISQQLMSNKLEAVMLHILQNANLSLAESRSSASRNYKNIVRAMNDNIDKPLTLDQLAQLTGLTTANLKKCFQKYSGMGVMAYFTKLKMAKAKSLIQENLSMREISERLGYSSQNYFSTVFKREYGLSPLDYKKSL